MIGKNLKTLSLFVRPDPFQRKESGGWTPDGADCIEDCSEETGGTATAIRLADSLDIPIRNLANPAARVSIQDYRDNPESSPSP